MLAQGCMLYPAALTAMKPGIVMKKTSASAASPKVHVSELQRRTQDARKRAEAAKKHARDAKQRAREARRLFKEAKRVARKARDELTAFSKKLKKLIGDKLGERGAKDVSKGVERAKPAQKKAKRVTKRVKGAAKSEPKKAKLRVAARPQPKKVKASKPQAASGATPSRAKGTRRTRRAKVSIPDSIAAAALAGESSGDVTSQQRTEESTT